jgi:sulfur carrier protein ThiS
VELELEVGSTIRQALDKAGIHPSTVLVSHEEKILPHATVLNGDVNFELIVVSSGG